MADRVRPRSVMTDCIQKSPFLFRALRMPSSAHRKQQADAPASLRMLLPAAALSTPCSGFSRSGGHDRPAGGAERYFIFNAQALAQAAAGMGNVLATIFIRVYVRYDSLRQLTERQSASPKVYTCVLCQAL